MSGPRVLVHAGFYKTGTTSLQRFLGDNRAALTPWFAYYGPGDFHNAGAEARRYGQEPFPGPLKRFRLALRSFLQGVPDAENIVLSRENFTGAMPGHRDWLGEALIGFPHAKPLLRDLKKELRRRFGPEARIETLFTTRERTAWLRSIHGHLLRSIRLEEDFEQFSARFAALGPLSKEARRLGADHVVALEDIALRHCGPAAAVLDLMGVPQTTQEALPAAQRANTGQDAGLQSEFLRLNRSDLPKPALKAAKEALLRKP